MNKIINAEALVSAVPLDKPEAKKMTRTEKLLRWAEIIRPLAYVRIYHRLEYYTKEQLKVGLDWANFEGYRADAIFGIAVSDSVLREQGLIGTKYDETRTQVSPQQIMDFFELTQAELHEFSCDCGGSLTGKQIAARMEKLAATQSKPSLVSRIRAAAGV